MSYLARVLRIVFLMTPRILAYRRIRKRIREGKPYDEVEASEEAKRFVDALISLGPSFIKFGQVLSVRSDIMPEPYLKELKRLQDEVPPAPFEEVKGVLEEDIPDIKVEEVPMAAASLGQVHRGVTGDGRTVAVKVNRPGIEETLKQDIAIIRRLLPLTRLFLDSSLVESVRIVVGIFSRRVFEELDYRKEAENMRIISEELKGFRVRIPTPIKVSKRVLVMDYIPGFKVTSPEAWSIVDRKNLAWRVFRIFLTQVLEGTVFHADPHPGNIAVDQEGNIILYDYGMVGKMDRETRLRLIRLYSSISSGDPVGLVRVLDELGAVQPDADREVLVKGFEITMRQMQGLAVDQIEMEDFQRLADEAFYRFPLRLPERLAVYLRMASVLEGTCQEVDPEFQFIPNLVQLVDDEGLLREAYLNSLTETYREIRRRIAMTSLRSREGNRNRGGRSAGRAVGPLMGGLAVVTYLLFREPVIALLVAMVGLSIASAYSR